MTSARQSNVPAAALNWLLGAPDRRVLTLGSQTPGLTEQIAGGGHQVTHVDREPKRLARPSGRLQSVVGQAESLPFAPCSFDVVLANQVLHRFAPGLALSEFARVLVPGGNLSIMYIVRDDSVPWVGKLRDVLQSADPSAMSGAYGAESVQRVEASAYFPEVDEKSFRIWAPVRRDGLLSMVGRRATAADVPDDERGRLLAEVGALYDSYARSPEPLLLPYRATCWRAWVDHTELTASIEPSDEGLSIPI